MAIFLSASKVSRGGRLRRPPMSDINVTPMVDVMLVLLVIFMVTAPLLNVGVPVDLREAAGSLGAANAARVARAVCHAAGCHVRMVTETRP